MRRLVGSCTSGDQWIFLMVGKRKEGGSDCVSEKYCTVTSVPMSAAWTFAYIFRSARRKPLPTETTCPSRRCEVMTRPNAHESDFTLVVNIDRA